MYERPMTLALLVIGALLIIVPACRKRLSKIRKGGIADGD